MTSILFINYNMHYGGAQRVLINLLKELVKFDEIKITLFLFRYEGAFLSEIPEKVKIIYLTYPLDCIFDGHYKEFINRIFYGITSKLLGKDKFCRLVTRLKLKETYDTEIAVKEGISKVMLANSKNENSQKIFWVHTDLRKFAGRDERDSFYYSKCNDIICVSEEVKIGFLYFYPELANKVHVINNLINEDDILAKSNMEGNPYNSNNINVVNLGRLSKEKGHERLIRVHYELISQGFIHSLHIIGDGGEHDNLERLIKELNVTDSVTLWGAKKNPYPYLKYADIYVHSSLNEGLPTVFFECICLRIPLVTTNVTGADEILYNGKYGYIVENSYEGLLEGYKRMLTDDKIKYDLTKNMDTYVSKNKDNLIKYLKVLTKGVSI